MLINPDWLRPRHRKSENTAVTWLASKFAGAGQVVVRRRWRVVGCALAVMALTPLGLRRLVVQDSWTNGFDPESEFRRVTQQVNDNFFGMHLLFICADAPKTIHGRNALRLSFIGPDIALPAALVGDAGLIAGSPINFCGRTRRHDSAVWQSHIEMREPQPAIPSLPDLPHGRRQRIFQTRWQKRATPRFEIPVRTHFEPELIRALGDFGTFIREHRQDAVGGVLGPSDYVTTTRFMIRPEDPMRAPLPDDAGEIKTLWNYYAMAWERSGCGRWWTQITGVR